jgi:hypothetical protein
MVYFQDRGQGQAQPPFKPFSQGMFSGGSAFERSTGLEDPDLELKFKLAQDIAQTTGVDVNPNEYSRDQLEDILARSVGQNIQTLKAQQGAYETVGPARRRQDMMTLEQINEDLPKETIVPEQPSDVPYYSEEDFEVAKQKSGSLGGALAQLGGPKSDLERQTLAGFDETVQRKIEGQILDKFFQETGKDYTEDVRQSYENEQALRRKLAEEGYEPSELSDEHKAVERLNSRLGLMSKNLNEPITGEGLTPDAIQEMVRKRNQELGTSGLIDTSELTPEQARLLNIEESGWYGDWIIQLSSFTEKVLPGMAQLGLRTMQNPFGVAISTMAGISVSPDPQAEQIQKNIFPAGPVKVIKDLYDAQRGKTPQGTLGSAKTQQDFSSQVDTLDFLSQSERDAIKTIGFSAAATAADLNTLASNIGYTLSLERRPLRYIEAERYAEARERGEGPKLFGDIGGYDKGKIEEQAAREGLMQATRGGAIIGQEIALSPLYASGTRLALGGAKLATQAALKTGEYGLRGAGKVLPYVPAASKYAVKGTKAAAKVGGKAAVMVGGAVAGGMAGGLPGAIAGLIGGRGLIGATRFAGRVAKGAGRMIFGGAKKTATKAATKEGAEALTKTQQIVKEIFENQGPTAAANMAAKLARTSQAVGDAQLAGYWWDVAGTSLNVGMVNGMLAGLAEGDMEVGFNAFLIGTAFGGVGGLFARASLPSNLKYSRNVFSKTELSLVKNSSDRKIATLAQSNFGDGVRITFAKNQADAENLVRQYATTGSQGRAYQPGKGKQFRTDSQTGSKTGELAKGSYLAEDASAPGTLRLVVYPDGNGRYANSIIDALPDTLMRGTSNPGARAKLARAVYENIPASQLDAFAKLKGLQDYRTNAASAQKLISEVAKEQIRMAGPDAFYPGAKGIDARAIKRTFRNRGGDSPVDAYPEVQRAIQEIMDVKPDAKVIIEQNKGVWRVRPKRDAVQSGKKGRGPKDTGDGGGGGGGGGGPKGGGPKGGPEPDPSSTGVLSRIVRNVDETTEVVPTQASAQATAATTTTQPSKSAETPKAKYSPEIRAKLDDLDVRYATQRESLARDKARLDAIPDSWKRGVMDEQIGYSKRSKALGYKYAAERRQILGEDPATAARLAKREKTLYRGKQVAVDGQPAEVVGNVFGKVKVKMADGTERTVARDVVTDVPKTPEAVTPEAPTPKATPENTVNYPVRARDIGDGKAEIEIQLRNGDTIPVTVDAELVPNLKSDWSESTVPFQIDEGTGQAFIAGRRDLYTSKSNIVEVEESPIDMTALSPRDKAIARSEARKVAKKLKEPKAVAEIRSQDPDALDWDSLKDDAIDTYSKAPNKADWEEAMTKKLSKKKKGGFVSAEWLPNLLSRVWDSMKDVFGTIRNAYQGSRFAGTRGAAGDLAGKAEGGLRLGKKETPQISTESLPNRITEIVNEINIGGSAKAKKQLDALLTEIGTSRQKIEIPERLNRLNNLVNKLTTEKAKPFERKIAVKAFELNPELQLSTGRPLVGINQATAAKLSPTADGRELVVRIDPATVDVNSVTIKDFKDIKKTAAKPTIVDRLNTIGANEGGGFFPFLAKNQVAFTVPDLPGIPAELVGKKFKPVWAADAWGPVKNVKTAFTGKDDGYMMLQLMGPDAHASNRTSSRTFAGLMKNLSTDEQTMLKAYMLASAEQKALKAKITASRNQLDKLKEEGAKPKAIVDRQAILDKHTAALEPYNRFLDDMPKPPEGSKSKSATEVSKEHLLGLQSKYQNEAWFKKAEKSWPETVKARPFVFRKSALLASRKVDYAPNLDDMLLDSSDFLNGKNLDMIGGVQVSTNPNVSAIYLGTNPADMARLTATEKALRDVAINSGYTPHESYSWVFLGPENADTFLLNRPVSIQEMFLDPEVRTKATTAANSMVASNKAYTLK